MPLKKITAKINGQTQVITANVPEGTTDEQIIQYVSSSYGGTQEQQPQPASLVDKTLEFTRGLESIPAFAAGSTAAKAAPPQFKIPAAAVAGGATYLGLDRLLQGMMESKPKTILGGDEDPNWNALENLILSEVPGRVAAKGVGAAKSAWQEFMKPGSKVDPILFKLKGTYSQYTGKRLPKLIEDVFTTKSKQIAQERSAELGRKELLTHAALESGIAPSIIVKPHALAKGATATAATVERKMRQITAEQADLARQVALDDAQLVETKIKPTSLTDPKNRLIEIAPAQPPVLDPKTGAVVTPAVPARLGRMVYGPTYLSGTLEKAQNILLDLQRKWGDIVRNPSLIPEEKRDVANAARNLLTVAEAEVDKQTGQILKHNPISFDDAWEFKKAIDPLFDKDHAAAELTEALNKDIAESIPNWKTPRAAAALDGFTNAKAISGDRISTFIAKDPHGNPALLKKLISHGNNEITAVESILNSPTKLQKALTLNKLPLPTGSVIMTNMRGILRGYTTGRILDAGWQADERDLSKSIFNASKIIKTLNDPSKQESYKLLYSTKGLQSLRELVQGLATTQQKMIVPGPYIKYAWPTRAGITLAAGLIAGNMSGPASLFGTGVVGLVLGGQALGKLMVNENTARIMVALSKGEKSASNQYIGRSIVGALKGTHDAVGLQKDDGSVQWGEIDKDGKFVENKKD